MIGCLFLAGLNLFTPQHIDFGLHLEGDLLGLAGGTLACGAAAALFSFPVTLMFGSVPRSMLRKLLDLDHPVLRDLAEKAPGTFQHSLALANMAEKVADSIGADDELARAGAYYHDIGKMQKPEYFIENQQGENPHDKLAPEQSAEKLRTHIDAGITIARGANLPERLVDFIIEHHGSSTMEYFLDKAYQLNQKTIEPDKFQYEGRNPNSKETAILMIVDAVEAASRTLQKPDHDEIENLVRRIIFSKMLHGYLDQSGLTTRDLKQIGISLIKFLQGQYHVRVEYPWQKKLDERPPLLVVPDTHAGIRAVEQPVRVVQPVKETAGEKTDKDV
jgi:putative nucleotidyltransferase with HDIG domain